MAAALLLAGCASFSPDGGFEAIQSASRAHIQQDVVWARDDETRERVQVRVDALLARPLTADDAVQVALLNNPGLQSALYALGIAESDWVSAQRLPNPVLTVGRFTRGGEEEWDRALHVNLARLLTMSMRADIEQRLFEQTRRNLTLEVLRLASDTRKAWVNAVAAAESAQVRRQAMDAAEAGAELARRMAEAGNWSKLSQAREQAFYADAALAVARAEQVRLQTREQLVRLLGVEDPARVQLPARLPELPASLAPMRDVEQQAMRTRIDLQMVKLDAEALGKNYELTRSTRFVNVLELGIENNISNEEQMQHGYEISFELPLFDFGESRLVAAESRYRQMLERAREIAVNARSQVREAHAMLQSQHGVARHVRDEVLPLKKRISEETLLRYNGMLVGVFDLLADARSQLDAVNAAIESQRDFWLAEADLQMALIGKPGKTPITTTTASAPADAGGSH
jgi:outer membrane protein TolC